MKLKQTKVLERIFYSVLLLVALVIIFTPYIIREGISIFEEELVEMILTTFLFLVAVSAFYLFRRELAKLESQVVQKEKKLEDAFKYIGRTNIYIDQIKSIFADNNKYPKSKKDFKNIIDFLSAKILSIISVDFVMLRIVDSISGNTLREYTQGRAGAVVLKAEVSNKLLLTDKKIDHYSFVATDESNITARIFCIMPEVKLSHEQKIFVKAILNQLQMIFLIFNSDHYSISNGEE